LLDALLPPVPEEEEEEVLGAPPNPLLDEVLGAPPDPLLDEVLGAPPDPLLDELDEVLAELLELPRTATVLLLQEAERSTKKSRERVCTLRMAATLTSPLRRCLRPIAPRAKHG
jgi:hypothetical protein